MLWLLIALPALSGAALMATGRRADRIAPGIAIAAATTTLIVAAVDAAIRPIATAPFLAGMPVSLRVDGLSAVMIVTVAAIVAVVLVFAAGDLGPEQARSRFFGLMLMFAAAMLATVTADSLIMLLPAWELMGAASYALIGFWWRDTERAESGLVAFLTTRTGDVGLYLAAGAALAGGSGSLAFGDLPALDGGWRDIAAAGVVLAAMGKSAQLPFSFWLSRAMAGPSPVSALLHSATMVAAGAYLLVRLQPLLAATEWASTTVAWIGAATALALGAVAVCQRDLKQLLAASTCAQVGLMVLAAGAGGIAAGTGHLMTHAVTKCLLFLAAGAWLTAVGTKDLHGLRGSARRYPVVGVTFTIGALSLAGVPALSLWVTKDDVLAAALHDSTALYIAGFAAGILSAVYAGRAVVLVWSPETTDALALRDLEEVGTRRVGVLQVAPMAALSVAAVALSAAVIPSLRDRFAEIIGGPGPTPAWWEYLLSGTVATGAVVVTAAVLRRRGDLPAPAVLTNWLGLESLARLLIAMPVLAVARWLARFDDRVLDRGVYAGAAAVMAVSRVADRRGEVTVDGMVGGIGSGARVLGRWARRPQTGQLHQYYAQAVVALALLAVALMALR